MPSAFNFHASPFDCLSADERALVRAGVDIGYFPADAVILDVGAACEHLFVVIKGLVQQWDGDEQVARYGPDDTFDGRSLVAGRATSRFVAAEEVVAYLLARSVVNELIARNATFGALVFSALSEKLRAISGRHSQHELQALTTARVDESHVRPALFVEAETDVVSVVRLFQAQRTTCVLVRDAAATPPRIGIFTATALQRAVLLGKPLDRLPVAELANFTLIRVRPSDPLGEALAVMIRHQVHRVVVADGERIVGVLEAMDVFSFLSNHSYLISLQIAGANDLDALAAAARHTQRLIGLLQANGTKVGLIATLVHALDVKLFERAWQIVAPAGLVANSCLFVMGSEGRGEQLLKTDQDNGLLLRDGYTPPADLDAICERFSAALAGFGYPPCPGGVMLSRPAWRASVSAFAARVGAWLLHPDGEQLMSLAIFIDAQAVCGDAALLEQVRAHLQGLAHDDQAMLARFAAAVDVFAGDRGLWRRLLGGPAEAPVDIKKAGLFPLVHGVRSLAFEAGLRETGTAARAQGLVAIGRLDPALGAEVVESLHFFMGVRLAAGLAEMARGQPVSGRVDPAALSSLERDLLKDTLAVVKRFRQMLRMHFRLDAL
jgi:CBS domain-containing protein